MRPISFALVFGILAASPPAIAQRAAAPPRDLAVDTALYDGMRYRMVGPYRGGRSTAVTGIANRPHTFLMGSTGGGVWRTEDAGQHWTNLTDGYLSVGNVGAIDVADSDPNVIYVGTGSACIRGNVSVGRGVWRSTDGGASWRFLGLPESGAIGALVVHPTNPELVYVAALGHPFGKNSERGVFRSRDGGANWERVLYLNDSTGAVSLAMNPANPREIFAGMWRAERKPWTLISGGPEGGVYRTTDGGDTWTKVGGGLPEGLVGKVGLAVSPANPRRIWALIEAEPDGGLYRSDDGGERWARVNAETRVRQRPFYYTHVEAHPTDENTVYILTTQMLRSVDGGRTVEQVPVPHGDTHDLWINPNQPEIFALADDGGVVVSVTGGRTFSSVYNQPTAELYDVAVDNQYPYRLYGSQQDNSTISVRHRLGGNTLRPQQEWMLAAGCETGPVALHPDRPEIIWGGCYGGTINRWDLRSDNRRNMLLYPQNPSVAVRDLRYRFQWVAPIVVSPHDPGTVYHASQYVHRTRDGGMTWETISPDLTTNDPAYQGFPGGPITPDHTGVEVFETIFSLAISPHDSNTIWAGTDDGRVHLTRDGGGQWLDVTPKGLPALATVNRIEVSAHDPARAFLAVQRYRLDDFRPYIYRTDDYGRSWSLLTSGRNGIPADHPTRVVREDPVRRGLLFAGTEFAIFVSFDDGARWQSLQLNLPATPVTDLKVHRGDLVVSTQGRSFWILDDLGPLRELGASPLVAGVARLFAPRPAERVTAGEPMQELDLTRPDPLLAGATISYALTRDASHVTLDILDQAGGVIRPFTSDSAASAEAGTPRVPTRRGLHRYVWDLTYPGARPPRGGTARSVGIKAPPGIYQVRLTVGDEIHLQPLQVVGNPLDGQISQADYDEQFRVSRAVRDTLDALYRAVETIRAVKEQAQSIVQRARTAKRDLGRLPALADSLAAELDTLEAALASRPRRTVDGLRAPAQLDSQYGTLLTYLTGIGGYVAGSTEGRPTKGALERQRDLDRAWSTIRARLAHALATNVSAFNAEVSRLGLPAVLPPGS